MFKNNRFKKIPPPHLKNIKSDSKQEMAGKRTPQWGILFLLSIPISFLGHSKPILIVKPEGGNDRGGQELFYNSLQVSQIEINHKLKYGDTNNGTNFKMEDFDFDFEKKKNVSDPSPILKTKPLGYIFCFKKFDKLKKGKTKSFEAPIFEVNPKNIFSDATRYVKREVAAHGHRAGTSFDAHMPKNALKVVPPMGASNFEHECKEHSIFMSTLLPVIGNFFTAIVQPMIKGLASHSKSKGYNHQIIEIFLPKAFLGNQFSQTDQFKQVQSQAHNGNYPAVLSGVENGLRQPHSVVNTEWVEETSVYQATIGQLIRLFDLSLKT